MPEESKDRSALAGFVATGKDLIAMLRDAMLLLIAILLLGWPQAVNNILVEAGFEEGSFAGIKWKAKVAESDEALLKAQTVINDLKDQNEQLNQTLAEVKPQIRSPATRENIARLDRLNLQLLASSAKVQASLEKTTSQNAPLVQKIRTTAGSEVTWGVVFGADPTLDAARHEIRTTAIKLGLPNAANYWRQGSFRSVATTADRVQAERLLAKAKEARRDAYLVNMASWCPKPVERNGYFECAGP